MKCNCAEIHQIIKTTSIMMPWKKQNNGFQDLTLDNISLIILYNTEVEKVNNRFQNMTRPVPS